MKILGLLGKVILLLATTAFIACASLFVIGSYLVTWPVLRQSPNTRRKQASMQLVVALMTMAQAFAPDVAEDENTDAT